MNTLVQNQFDVLHQTQAIRQQIMDTLTDADLIYRLPGTNITLGALCREMGETQQIYIDSFKTFQQDWGYKVNDPALETSVDRLKAWYKKMDAEMDAVLTGLSDEVIQNQMVDRGHGTIFPVGVQFHVYREALLIFYGKTSIYLRALNKPLSEQLRTWIG